MAFGEWIHRAFVLSMNLVPLVGVLKLGWSASTLLAVYWVETLIAGTANVLRIWLHRRFTRTLGHWRIEVHDPKKAASRAVEGSFLQYYAAILYSFTLGHGLFLCALLLAFNRETDSPWSIDGGAFRTGVLAVAALTLVELLWEGMSLGSQPFSWLKARVGVALGRVVALHLSLIVGVFLMMRYDTPMSLLAVLVGLKALADIGPTFASREISKKPPRWFTALGKGTAQDAEREWQEKVAEEKRQAEENELKMDAPGS